jgi:hypothetical protein
MADKMVYYNAARTKKINTLEHLLPFRDQGVGGSNPLARPFSNDEILMAKVSSLCDDLHADLR